MRFSKALYIKYDDGMDEYFFLPLYNIMGDYGTFPE